MRSESAPVHWVWWIAIAMPACAGAAFMGVGALATVLASGLGAAVAWQVIKPRVDAPRGERVWLSAMVCGLTLPPGAGAAAAVCGALVAVAVRLMPTGDGQGQPRPIRWNPAMVARVVGQFVVGSALLLTPHSDPPVVLNKAHVLFGDVSRSVELDLRGSDGWYGAIHPTRAHAWRTARITTVLREAAPAGGGAGLTAVVRDRLPPWSDAVIGATPGECGSSCAGILAVAILLLVYGQAIRLQLIFGLLAAGFVVALVLPLGGESENGLWFAAWATSDGIPTGLIYGMYHLVSGQLLLAALVVGCDPESVPIRRRSQFVFGLGIGAGIIVMRLYGIATAEAAWPILIMNTTTPLLDRLFGGTRPRSASNVATTA